MNKFWMVYADNSTQTRVRHESYDAARAEATRLARNAPGVKFFVLGSEGFAIKRDIDWHDTKADGAGYPPDDEIPF